MFFELFVIITNFAGIVPILYSYKKRIYYESVVYLCTTIASLVYHTIYAFKTINDNNARNMVKYVDFVLAFCCIHSIVYLIMINNNLHRNIFLFISTFIEMYFNYISLDSIGHLFTTIFIAIFLSLLYNFLINRRKFFSFKNRVLNIKCFTFALFLNFRISSHLCTTYFMEYIIF